METACGSVAVTRLPLLPEFSTSAAESLWLEEMLEMVWEASTEAEVSLPVAEVVGVTIMKHSFSGVSSFPL